MYTTRHTHVLPEAARTLRQEVFVDEQGFQEEFDTIDAAAVHFLLWDDDVPVATLRLFGDPKGCLHLGRMAVSKSYRGQGAGKELMQNAIAYARNLGAQGIVLSSQAQVQSFYESLGFVSEGAPYLDEGWPHVRMRLVF